MACTLQRGTLTSMRRHHCPMPSFCSSRVARCAPPLTCMPCCAPPIFPVALTLTGLMPTVFEWPSCQVRYACREYVRHVKDFIAFRSRLAFLNTFAAGQVCTARGPGGQQGGGSRGEAAGQALEESWWQHRAP